MTIFSEARFSPTCRNHREDQKVFQKCIPRACWTSRSLLSIPRMKIMGNLNKENQEKGMECSLGNWSGTRFFQDVLTRGIIYYHNQCQVLSVLWPMAVARDLLCCRKGCEHWNCSACGREGSRVILSICYLMGSCKAMVSGCSDSKKPKAVQRLLFCLSV